MQLFQKIQKYKYSSYFLIIFALLDNFGYNGGRNGFLYVEGVGALIILLKKDFHNYPFSY